MNKAEAALLYASWGWKVLPVVPNGKIPATAHGVRDATRDPEQIARWWTQNPDFNIGVAAGAASGILVFDVDPRNGGETSWEDWVKSNGAVPDGPMQLTAGGGQHYLTSYDSDIRSCKLGEGIDLLSDGKYFLAHPSSIEGRTYEWEASSDPFDGVAPPPLPREWKAAYQARRKPVVEASTGSNLIQGSRNNGLTALGGAMRRYGMTEAEIMAALTIANETRCEIPLPSSELVQIVRSVSRYEPESDVAADVALGADAADRILSVVQAETQEYYFTRATSYLSQPAPLRWVIKGWLPDNGTAMVYGESGAGKTFVTLDMACCIASGRDWHGRKTKPGIVVYMAGEGNYGLRQRIASWCRYNGVNELDNLLISNKAIDIDSPAAAAQVIGAVRELTDDNVSCVFIDTVNNHMSGDENSAKDTRNMFNACAIVSRALSAAVCLNHHSGHAQESKGRARGSSAWKASLDSSILVSTNDERMIELECTKMKDTEPPASIYGLLKPVPLGWVDEDGEEITGAVFEISDEPPPTKSNQRESAIQSDIKKMTNAWFASGAEIRESCPYISRSGLMDYLINKNGMKEASASAYVRPSQKGKLIYNLLNAEIITAYEHGWIVSMPETRSAMVLMKGSELANRTEL